MENICLIEKIFYQLKVSYALDYLIFIVHRHANLTVTVNLTVNIELKMNYFFIVEFFAYSLYKLKATVVNMK